MLTRTRGEGRLLAVAVLATSDATGVATTTLETNRTTVVTASAAGESATATVTRRENVITNVVITATSSTAVAGAGQSFSFAAAVTPTADSQQVSRFEWDFGDNTTVTGQSGTQSHVFTSNGVRTVTVRVILQDGREATGQTQVIVSGI
jgi:PKD repeat protein